MLIEFSYSSSTSRILGVLRTYASHPIIARKYEETLKME